MDAVYLYKESIRDDILYLAELKKQTGSERNILNKWFQDSIKNYFLETYASPFLKNQLGDGIIKNVKPAIESKIDNTGGQKQLKCMKLVDQYKLELQLHGQAAQFINSLVNILIHQSGFERGSSLWAKQTKKKFVALLLIVLFEQTITSYTSITANSTSSTNKTANLTSFYDIWNTIYPSSTQVKKKLSKEDKKRLRDNGNLSFYLPPAAPQSFKPYLSAWQSPQQQQQQKFQEELQKEKKLFRLRQSQYPSSLLPSKQTFSTSSTLSSSSTSSCSSLSSVKRKFTNQVEGFTQFTRICDYQEINNPKSFYQITMKTQIHPENQQNTDISLSLGNSPLSQPTFVANKSDQQDELKQSQNQQKFLQIYGQQEKNIQFELTQKHGSFSRLSEQENINNHELINTPVLFQRMSHVLPQLQLAQAELQSKSNPSQKSLTISENEDQACFQATQPPPQTQNQLESNPIPSITPFSQNNNINENNNSVQNFYELHSSILFSLQNQQSHQHSFHLYDNCQYFQQPQDQQQILDQNLNSSLENSQLLENNLRRMLQWNEMTQKLTEMNPASSAHELPVDHFLSQSVNPSAEQNTSY